MSIDESEARRRAEASIAADRLFIFRCGRCQRADPRGRNGRWAGPATRRTLGLKFHICGDCAEREEREVAREADALVRRRDAKNVRFGHLPEHHWESGS